MYNNHQIVQVFKKVNSFIFNTWILTFLREAIDFTERMEKVQARSPNGPCGSGGSAHKNVPIVRINFSQSNISQTLINETLSVGDNDHHANNHKEENIEEVGAAVREECKGEVSLARTSVSSNDTSAVVYTKSTSLSESEEEDQGLNGSGPPPASRKRKVAREASTSTNSASDTKSKRK
jgi:hypothetical protein